MKITAKNRRRWMAVPAVAAMMCMSVPNAFALEEQPDIPDEPTSQTQSGADSTELEAQPDEVSYQRALADDERVVPGSEYSLLGVSSQMDPYPGPGYVDGTAEAVFTDDLNDTWAVRYTVENGQGVANDSFPHWIAFDSGDHRDMTALQYAIKNQTSGPATDYKVYVSDADGAPDPQGDWGAAVAEGTLPTATPQTHTIQFSEPVRARWVRFEIHGSVHPGNVSGASLLRVVEKYQEETTEPPAGPTDPATPATLSQGDFTVHVGQEFPQIIDYSIGGATLKGNAEKLSQFSLNGQPFTANTVFTQESDVKASYQSTFADPQWSDLIIKSSLTVGEQGTIRFAVDSIEGRDEANLRSIGIPEHHLVQIDSSQPGAVLSRTSIDTDTRRAADQHIRLGATTAVDSDTVASPYAFVSTADIAAGVYTNSTLFTGATNTDDRLITRIRDEQGTKVAAVSSNSWVWAPMAPGDNGVGEIDPRVARFELPEVIVAVAADLNQSGSVDWQDAALALRDHIPVPLGAERVPERVAQRIPFNFGSEASNPFLKTLDNLKRVSLATDGLGQWLLLKGFGSEGHDSANTDYGGHYNERAGGLEDLNALVAEGHDNWNADFAVHVNTTEAYPQARAFSDAMTNDTTVASGKGWGWLNQSYYINQFYDLGSGDVIDRFQQLRDETDIDTVYIDVYYSAGWRAEGLADQLHAMGFEVATEWAHKFEGNSIWSHWSNDKSYGGIQDKGINSDMIRFMFNTERDVWNIDPLLGGVNMLDFEGWAAKDNYNAYLKSLWTDNLPTKYLQHFPITSWEPGSRASLSNGVEIAMDNGTRVVTQGGVEVLRGDPANLTYLLPWGEENAEGISDPLQGTKMYHYSTQGGEHDFALTSGLAGYTSFEQYKLTDSGREKVADISADGGHIQLSSEPGTAYVVVPNGDTEPYPAPQFGQYTPVADPGFDAGNLDAWNPQGSVSRTQLDNGDNVAVLGEGPSSISQHITGLTPGEQYRLAAMVEIGPKAERNFTMTAGPEENSFSTTPALNRVGSEPKHNTYMQRAFISFAAPESGSVEIAFAAGDGQAPVTIDDVRIQKIETLTQKAPLDSEIPLDSLVSAVPEGALFWDFEDNQPGFGPFVRGGAGGLSDARTSISELHDPYSQSEWKNNNWPHNGSGNLAGRGIDDVLSGTHSLKSYDDYSGLLYRTIPASVSFDAGHAYRVSFSYQATLSNEYHFVVGTDDLALGTPTTISSVPLQATEDTQRWQTEFVAGCEGVTFIGMARVAGEGSLAELVIDDVMIEDLGATDEAPTCATLTPEPSEAFTKGAANRLVTSFTNHESTSAMNVAMTLSDLPEGWIAQTEEQDGNLFETVAPGDTVTTTWLIQVPGDTEVTEAHISVTAEYAIDCQDRSLSTQADVAVSPESRMAIPKSAITATTSMKNQGSEPIENALVDSDDLWHSSWSGSVELPAWVEFSLNGPTTIDGWGYQQRPTGVNGRLKNYRIEVMTDGQWQQVASGTWEAATSLQVADFAPVVTDKVRMHIDSVYPGDNSGNTYTSARRLILYGIPAEQESGFEPGQRPQTDPNACAEVPHTTMSLEGERGVDGWFVTAPTLTLATDSGQENVQSWYRFGEDSDFEQYSGPVTVPDGIWQIQYYSAHANGTTEGIQTSEWVKVDTEAPVVTGSFSESSRVVVLEALDTVSGVAAIEYSLDAGQTWVTFDQSIQVGDDAGSIMFRARDNAGNLSEVGSLDFPAGETPQMNPQIDTDKKQVRAGDSLFVTVSGLTAWSAPTVEIGIASEYQKLTDMEVSASGTASGTVVIPDGISAGVHTVMAKDATGNTVASTTVEVLVDQPGGTGECTDADGCSSSQPERGGLSVTGAIVAGIAAVAAIGGILGLALVYMRRRHI